MRYARRRQVPAATSNKGLYLGSMERKTQEFTPDEGDPSLLGNNAVHVILISSRHPSLTFSEHVEIGVIRVVCVNADPRKWQTKKEDVK